MNRLADPKLILAAIISLLLASLAFSHALQAEGNLQQRAFLPLIQNKSDIIVENPIILPTPTLTAIPTPTQAPSPTPIPTPTQFPVFEPLRIDFGADPESGAAPLSASLVITVSGGSPEMTVQGYSFDCTADGEPELVIAVNNQRSFRTQKICVYPQAGFFDAQGDVLLQFDDPFGIITVPLRSFTVVVVETGNTNPTMTATPTPTLTPTPTPTSSPMPTATPTPTPTPSPTPTPTATPTPTPATAFRLEVRTEPNGGAAPLNGVDLIASVSGAAAGLITYEFDCTDDGFPERVVSTDSTSFRAVDVCNYSGPGNFTASVKATRQTSIKGFSTVLVVTP